MPVEATPPDEVPPPEDPPPAATVSSRWAWVLVAISVGFGLWVLRAETNPVHNLNDSSVHLSMVRWAEARWNAGQVPLDGWYPYLGGGLPQFHHYQSLPHILTGAAATVVGADVAFSWSLYLLLALWPLCIYWSARLFGFDRWVSGPAALVSPLLVSTTFYGYEHGSYTWRGLGVWSQLWGMWMLPLALALSWRAIARGKSLALAALALAVTCAMHFLTGYLALLCVGVWLLVAPSKLKLRLPRIAAVGIGAVLVASWVIVPVLTDSWASNQSQVLPGTFWNDSYGAGKVLGWMFRGKIFDDGRWPVITLLVGAGLVASLLRWRSDERARAVVVVFTLSLLLFFGRPTLGPILDLLPGSHDLLLHRFLMGVHLGGIFLAGIGAAWLGRGLLALARRPPRLAPVARSAAAPLAIAALGVLLLAPAWTEREAYNDHGKLLIDIQDAQDATDGADFDALVAEAKSLGPGRIYAGPSGGWGGQYTLGYVPSYVELLNTDADGIGFFFRTLSLTTDLEPYFNDTRPSHYQLFNVRFLILPDGREPPTGATRIDQRGRHVLWSMPTSGYLQVADTVGTLTADRTNLVKRVTPFLTSNLPDRGLYQIIRFDGTGEDAEPTLLGPSRGSPGTVDVEFLTPLDGRFGGRVTTSRTAEVVLKASWHPRWTATVDGEEVPTHMVTPSWVAVTVPAGTHVVTFQYRPYPHYLWLFLLAVVTLVGLELVPRRWRRRIAARTPAVAPAPPAASSTVAPEPASAVIPPAPAPEPAPQPEPEPTPAPASEPEPEPVSAPVPVVAPPPPAGPPAGPPGVRTMVNGAVARAWRRAASRTPSGEPDRDSGDRSSP